MDGCSSEIIDHILESVLRLGTKPVEFFRLKLVCRSFNLLISQNTMWKRILRRDFPNEWYSPDEPGKDYQSLFLERKKIMRFRKITNKYERFKSLPRSFEYCFLTEFECLKGEFVSIKHLPLDFNNNLIFKNHINITIIYYSHFELKIKLILDGDHFSVIDPFLVGAKIIEPVIKCYPPMTYALELFSPMDFIENLANMGFVRLVNEATIPVDVENCQIYDQLLASGFITRDPTYLSHLINSNNKWLSYILRQ